MNITKSWDKAIGILSAAALILVCFVSCTSILLNIITSDSYNTTSLSDGWTDGNGNAFSLDTFQTINNEITAPQRIYHTVYLTGKNTTLLFRCRNMFADVYLNGELISKDDKEQAVIYGTSPGSRWHIISLDSSRPVVTLCIAGTACYGNSHGLIDNIYIGTAKDVYRQVTTERLPGFILSVFLQIIGIILLILYAYLHRRFRHIDKDLLYLGVATFFSAQWASTESLLWQLFYGYSETFHLLGYLSLIAIPVPFGLLSTYRFKDGKLRNFSKIYSIVACINLLVATLLHVTGILEFHYSLKFTHLMIVLLMPIIVMLVLSYTDGSKGKRKNTIVYSALIMLTFCVLISILKYTFGQYSDFTFYIQIAILSFLFCLIVYQLNQIIGLFAKGLRADMMHTLALTDYLTGLYNRTAFAEHKKSYIEMVINNTPFGIIQFDVNNLKTVNDSLGHEKGDQLLKLASQGLKDCFQDIGKCYRMGGDEFLVILDGKNPEADYETGILALQNYCDTINQRTDLEFKLQIAHGFVLNQGTVLEDALEDADSRMYENKRFLKQK